METTNKSRVWKGKAVNAKHLSGLIIASGGIKLTGKTLADDYSEDFRALRIPALICHSTGQNIENLYSDLVGAGCIHPMDEEAHKDPAAYILSALRRERTGATILTDADIEKELSHARRSARRVSF